MTRLPAAVRTWRAVGAATAFALIGLTATALPQPAQAAPYGTVRIAPSTDACGGDALEDHVRCGAGHTANFLASVGAEDVVADTVLMQPWSVGIWKSTTTPGVCGFVKSEPVTVGLHHCDRVTFIDPRGDAQYLTGDLAATVILLHESAHGFQERAGFLPVEMTLARNTSSIRPLEQSADCWAGVGMAWLISEGELPESAETEARELFLNLGDDAGGHGASSLRETAFGDGYQNGAAACDTILGSEKVFPLD